MPCRGAKPLGPHPGICRQGCPLSLCFRSPRAFSLLAAALMRPAPIVNCVLRRTVSAQSTKLQSVGFCTGAKPSSVHSGQCLHQREREKERGREGEAVKHCQLSGSGGGQLGAFKMQETANYSQIIPWLFMLSFLIAAVQIMMMMVGSWWQFFYQVLT